MDYKQYNKYVFDKAKRYSQCGYSSACHIIRHGRGNQLMLPPALLCLNILKLDYNWAEIIPISCFVDV